MNKFKPLLAPNEQIDLNELSYPLLASSKMDGIRCIFYKGQILSRSLKQIQNKQLREKFELIRKYSEEVDVILDGEIYSPELTFQEITSYVMTQDFEDKKSIKKFGKVLTIPEHLKFYCFDCLHPESLNISFKDRFINAGLVTDQFPNIMKLVNHEIINDKTDILEYFEESIRNGFEGLILRDPKGKYKCGRGTIKEGIIYKLKPFRTFDAQIIDVEQSTEVNKDAEKKINELGRSVTSKKKGDRHLINKASAFWVEYEGKPLKVVLAMTDEEKVAVWANRANLIGKWVEYKGMTIGAKDVPRHPVFLRYRQDKE